eukprot:scaffold178779_cov17-Tisochrysis_lutea.AAC.1
MQASKGKVEAVQCLWDSVVAKMETDMPETAAAYKLASSSGLGFCRDPQGCSCFRILEWLFPLLLARQTSSSTQSGKKLEISAASHPWDSIDAHLGASTIDKKCSTGTGALVARCIGYHKNLLKSCDWSIAPDPMRQAQGNASMKLAHDMWPSRLTCVPAG